MNGHGLARGERLVLALLTGLGVFAVSSHVLLLLGLRVPPLLLPGAFVCGLVVAWHARAGAPLAPPLAEPPAPRWLSWSASAVLAITAVFVIHGSLASPSRHWDGAVAWDTRAFWLEVAPTLQQPFFADPAVASPARDYPLLQPLLIAAGNTLLGGNGGRLLFPLVWSLLALLVGTTLRRTGSSGTIAWLGTAATMLTPILVSPTSGAVDSGYGDALLLLCVTTAAAGLLRQDPRLLFLGTLLAVVTKPEGIVHAGVITGVAWCVGERPLLRAAAGGLLLGGALWLPLQMRLPVREGGSAWPLVAVLAACQVVLEALDALARRCSLQWRGRLLATLLALPLLALALPFLATASGALGGTMNAYLGDLGRPLERLSRVPAILLGAVNHGLLRGDFGLAFWAAGAGVLAAWRRGALRPLLPLALLATAGLLVALTPFLLSPEEDLAHHVRSSMPRLLLHWLGAVMLLGCAAISASVRQPNDRHRTDAAAP